MSGARWVVWGVAGMLLGCVPEDDGSPVGNGGGSGTDETETPVAVDGCHPAISDLTPSLEEDEEAETSTLLLAFTYVVPCGDVYDGQVRVVWNGDVSHMWQIPILVGSPVVDVDTDLKTLTVHRGLSGEEESFSVELWVIDSDGWISNTIESSFAVSEL